MSGDTDSTNSMFSFHNMLRVFLWSAPFLISAGALYASVGVTKSKVEKNESDISS